MKQIVSTIILMVAVLGGSLAVANSQPAHAINVFDQCSSSGKDSSVCKAAGTDSATGLIKTVIDTMLLLLGSIAVVMIVIGGIRYTTSNGEASQVQAAKNTIMYAIVGLAIAILSYSIVNFVVGTLK
jgi:hypothetical protein